MIEKDINGSPNGLSSDLVEIVGDNGAHYPAFVVDLMDPNTAGLAGVAMVRLRFENNWRQMETFPITRIRLPPVDVRQPQEFKVGSEVEVLATGQENEGNGYWKCVVKMCEGNFYVVSYSDLNVQKENFTQIVNKDVVRAVNTNPYLSSNPFFKFTIEVPKELFAMNPQLFRSSQTHEPFKKALSLIAVNYSEPNHQLVCVGFAETAQQYWFLLTNKRALILSEMHFNSLREKCELTKQIDSIKQQLNNFGEVVKCNANQFELRIKVDDHLIGLAIGANGGNLKQILKIPGIVSIDNLNGVFRIIGTSRDSCLIAKDRLQYIECEVQVSKDIVGHVIGRGGRFIQELTDKSGLNSVVIKGEDKTKPKPYVEFVLVGTREAVENGKILLNFQMTCIKENVEIDKQIDKTKPKPKKYFNRN